MKFSSCEYHVKWPFGRLINLSLYDGMADWINVLSHFTHDFTKNPGINIYIMVNKSPTSGIQYICHIMYDVISLDQLIPPCNIHTHGQPFLLSYPEHPIHNQLMGRQYTFWRDAIKTLTDIQHDWWFSTIHWLINPRTSGFVGDNCSLRTSLFTQYIT